MGVNNSARLLCFTLLLAPAALLAQAQPQARAEGLVLRLEPGWVSWSLDAGHIAGQTGLPTAEVQQFLVDQTQNGPGLTLGLGYNIKGHATVGLSLTGTGWDIGSADRGGGGLLAFEAAWHPVELFSGLRTRAWDASLFGGAGYFVMGEERALDGLHLQAGLRAEYFVTRWLSLGGALRYVSLRGSRYILDWNNDIDVPLPQGTGGSMLLPSLTIAVHAPLG
jgi:hypothetical protein